MSSEEYLNDLIERLEVEDSSQNSETVEIVVETDSQVSEEESDSSYEGKSSEEEEEEEEDYDERKEIPWKLVKEEIDEFMRKMKRKHCVRKGKRKATQKELYYVIADLYKLA